MRRRMEGLGVLLKIGMEIAMFPVRVIFWMMFAVAKVLSHLE